MSKLSNRLTPAEDEALHFLSEECGELVAIIGKIGRHGLYSSHPIKGGANLDLLHHELGDVLAAIQVLLINVPVLRDDEVARYREAKLAAVRDGTWFHHVRAP